MSRFWMLCFFVVFVFCLAHLKKGDVVAEYIRPYEKNAFYWQLDGEPVVLLGGV